MVECGQTMFENTVDLVKYMSVGPCCCRYECGSCSSGYYNPESGDRTPGHYDRGPRTFHCDRCKARSALEADGIPYEKDDRVNWARIYEGVKLNTACAPSPLFQGVIVTGSLGV